ncbi:hypothetical protein BBD42_24300 [Paenibacillus sp. BIHB 4019]|uniref:HTH araC/xylS-type domain-containing protein n=1 Tax=Paenibacillus sp. BIHB 4019 TaxID=1870819 RepID=A0A1B2DNH5_9BACL|nr:AraC family transcriptional regulator [Paenibacillus sp. BIHB 4019]ANY69252.1 hypothetical protein BBD42_24300 [Paenibacillus sp. BIHB 4019]
MNEIIYTTLTTTDYQLPVYVTGVGHWDHQEGIRRPEGFPDYQWTQVVSGEGELIIEQERFLVKQGDGFLLPPRLTHSYHAVKEPWEAYWFTYDGPLAESLNQLAGLTRPGIYTINDSRPVLEMMSDMLRLMREKEPGLGMLGSKQIYGVLLGLRQQLAEGSLATQQMNERLHPVLRYIEANLHRPITLPELAELLHVTPQHLCLLFKKTFKLRPMEYVNKERINKGKELLIRGGGMKLYEIARQVGFENPTYFNTLFKAYVGCTPGEFKQMHGFK